MFLKSEERQKAWTYCVQQGIDLDLVSFGGYSDGVIFFYTEEGGDFYEFSFYAPDETISDDETVEDLLGLRYVDYFKLTHYVDSDEGHLRFKDVCEYKTRP